MFEFLVTHQLVVVRDGVDAVRTALVCLCDMMLWYGSYVEYDFAVVVVDELEYVDEVGVAA